jgi:hypothetical protein
LGEGEARVYRGIAMRLGIAALTLAAGLGFVSLAAGQEGGTFLERVFSSPAAEKIEPAKKIEIKTEPVKPTLSINLRALKAKADLDRRQEVCMRLREIGLTTNDDDLIRKADMLDQRAWDLFVASASQARSSARPAVEAEAKKGDRK